MEILQDKAKFRPVTIRLATREDFDKMAAIISAVSDNKINHPPQIVKVARDLLNCLNRVELPD